MTVLIKPQGAELHSFLTWKIFKFSKFKWWDDFTPSLPVRHLESRGELPYEKVRDVRRKISTELLKNWLMWPLLELHLTPLKVKMPLKMEWFLLLANAQERISCALVDLTRVLERSAENKWEGFLYYNRRNDLHWTDFRTNVFINRGQLYK